MTLRELLESYLVKDDDRIRLHVTANANKERIIAGRWYNDQILKVMDYKIKSLSMDKFEQTVFWDITLEDGDPE